jgi:hypothetical protein
MMGKKVFRPVVGRGCGQGYSSSLVKESRSSSLHHPGGVVALSR